MNLDQPELPFGLFDEIEAGRRKEDGMERAEVGAGKPWIDHALECVWLVAEGSERFTTDDIWAVLGVGTITEPRAMGPVMREAAKRGWITKTDRTQKSKRPDCHARPLAIWLSNIYAADYRR